MGNNDIFMAKISFYYFNLTFLWLKLVFIISILEEHVNAYK